MAIADLEPRQGKVDLVAEVIDKGDVRTFEKFGKSGRVCNARIKDDSGEITLTLWNDEVDEVDVGDKVKITNGWVSEWQGEKQLSAGRFGKLEVVEKGSGDTVTESSIENKPQAVEDDIGDAYEETPEEDVVG